MLIIFSPGSTALVGQDLLLARFRDHTQTYHTQTYRTRYNSFGRAIEPSQRSQRDNTQCLQQRYHVSGGIRALNPSKRGTADPHFWPRGHQDRRLII